MYQSKLKNLKRQTDEEKRNAQMLNKKDNLKQRRIKNMSYKYAFPVKYTEDDNDTFFVHCPDVPGSNTDADTKEDIPARAQMALIGMLSARMGRGLPIPTPSTQDGLIVMLPPLVAAKLHLYEVMQEKAISQRELARRLNVDPKQVQRMLQLTNRTSIDDLDTAIHQLTGKHLMVELAA